MLTDLFFSRALTYTRERQWCIYARVITRVEFRAERRFGAELSARVFFFCSPSFASPSLLSPSASNRVDEARERKRARELFSRHVYAEHNAISSLCASLSLSLSLLFHKRTHVSIIFFCLMFHPEIATLIYFATVISMYQ